MKGVAFGVDSRLAIFDLSQENTPATISGRATYRSSNGAFTEPAPHRLISGESTPASARAASIVLQTRDRPFDRRPGQRHVDPRRREMGIAAVRRIDEKVNRRPGSEKSYTFHGRDIYASPEPGWFRTITFEQVGPVPRAEGDQPALARKPATDRRRVKGTGPR